MWICLKPCWWFLTDGAGFSSKEHLANSYDVGKSYGQGKGNLNYGQGEKAGGLKVRASTLPSVTIDLIGQIGDTILKLAQLPGRCRGVVMLSRTMQQKEFSCDFLRAFILRPVVHWQWQDGWVIDVTDLEDLKLVLECVQHVRV